MTKTLGFTDWLFNNWVFRIISIIALCATLYGGYKLIWKDKPSIVCEIVSDVNVIELNKNISRLNILVDSTNIIQDSLSLKVIELKIWNNGNDNLRHDFYVSNTIGLELNDGVIIEYPNVLSSSNDYIFEEVNNCNLLTDSITINLPKVSLDKNEYYTIQLLVLHPNNKIPTLNSKGKISGIKKIEITKTSKNNIEQSLDQYVILVTLCLVMLVLGSSLMLLYNSVKRSNKIIELNKKAMERLEDTLKGI